MTTRLSRVVVYVLFLGFLACSSREGTISIGVLSAPGSDLLTQIDRLEASLLAPDNSEIAHFEGTRDAQGSLTIAIVLAADGSNGNLTVEGFDSSGTRIAFGRAGPLPLAAVDATLSVFLAPPLSIREAPVSLDTPASHIGSTAASFGVLLAGGMNSDGAVSDVIVYNSYLHSLQAGLPMPVPLSQPTLVPGASGSIYMVGGQDAEQNPSNVALAFDTTQPPSGGYRALVMAQEHARAGVSAAVVGQEQYIISGNPALLLDGFQGTLRALQDGQDLGGPALTVVSDNKLQVLFAGADVASGAAIYEDGEITRLSPPPEMFRNGHRGILLPNGEILYLGGSIDDVATTTAVLYKPSSKSFQTIDLLATARREPAVAITDDYLVVVGGHTDDGAPVADVEVFDVNTLSPNATLPLVIPRKATSAQALNTGQVLIAGGLDANGDPIGLLELFTPDR